MERFTVVRFVSAVIVLAVAAVVNILYTPFFPEYKAELLKYWQLVGLYKGYAIASFTPFAVVLIWAGLFDVPFVKNGSVMKVIKALARVVNLKGALIFDVAHQTWNMVFPDGHQEPAPAEITHLLNAVVEPAAAAGARAAIEQLKKEGLINQPRRAA